MSFNAGKVGSMFLKIVPATRPLATAARVRVRNPDTVIQEALTIFHGIPLRMPPKQRNLFYLTATHSTIGKPNPEQYLQQEAHRSFMTTITSLSGPARLGLNPHDVTALGARSDGALDDLFKHDRGPATAAVKIRRALQTTSLPADDYLILLRLLYETHKIVIENTVPDMGMTEREKSAFQRDSSGKPIFDPIKQCFVMTPNREKDWDTMVHYVKTGIPPEAQVWIGYNGGTKSGDTAFTQAAIEAGSKEPSMADEDLGPGIYVTPSRKKAIDYAIKATRLAMISNPDPHPTALVLSVYVPYSDINPDTGLPKGTLFLPPLPSGFPRKKTALPPNGVLHNPDTRDLGGAELRIPLGTGTTPTLFTQPCTSVGDIIVPPLDFSNG